MKKYYVNENECFCIEDAISVVKDEICEDEFEAYLEYEYDYEAEVCGMSYNAVEILKEIGDFDDKFDEWKDEKEAEIERALERLSADEDDYIFGVEIRMEDTDFELVKNARGALESIKANAQKVPNIYGGVDISDELATLSEFIDKMEEKVLGGEE